MSIFRSQQLPSPTSSGGPPSPRKRQRLLRESEDAEGEMSLYQYIHRSDPFRSISFSDPDKSALKTSLVFANDDPARQLRSEIEELLQQHKVPPESSFRTCKATLGGSQFFLLRVTVRGENSTLIRFGPLKDAIMRLLRRNNLADMHVEILHAEYFSPPNLYPINPGNGLVGAFNGCKETIAEILNKALGPMWHIVCPFKVGGHDASSTRPAVVVFAHKFAVADWFQLRALMMYHLAKMMSVLMIEIEFVPGTLGLLDGGPVKCKNRFANTDQTKMGDSIGICGDNNAGTLGGFVEVRHNDRAHRGFLTNYHVVRPSSSTKLRDMIDRTGISMSSPIAHQRAIGMESIARLDLAYSLDDVRELLSVLESEKDVLETSMERRAMLGEDPPKGTLLQHQSFKIHIAKLEKTKQVFEQMPRFLGHVTFTSGLLVHGKRVLDWAFVELTPEMEQLYFKPNLMPDIPKDQEPDRSCEFPHGGGLPPLQPGYPLTDFGDFTEGRWYFKYGRTTGVTGGICNGSKALCNWKGSRYTVDGKECQMASHYTEEFLILGVKGNFVERGDSGAFVVSDRGQVAGLLFADVQDENGVTFGVAFSIPDILETMRLRLNGPVTLHLP
ncbi:unnamed protein product [Penicillium olsonii]|nr:unnamed protein product [Penicillium olsonii]